MLHFYKTPALAKWFLPGLVWDIKTSGKEVFLTFDDGPVPGVTEWVLDTLSYFHAKATFFVVGENAEKNTDILQRISHEGHAIGNHTYNHLNSWKHNTIDYIENIRLCDKAIKHDQGNRQLFRPPHGKLSPALIRKLKNHYSIIMWDVLTGDYDQTISFQDCLTKSLQYTRAGSIVVFHDSYKSEKKLKAVLPEYLEDLIKKGYSFRPLLQ